MANISPTTAENPILNSGYGTPSDPAQGIKSDYIFRDPANYGSAKVILGRVVDTFPEKNVCLVMAGYEGFVKCTYATGNQSNVSGVTAAFSPGVGDAVLFAKTEDTDYGWILSGAINQAEVPLGSAPSFPKYKEYKDTYFDIRKSETFDCQELDLECKDVNIVGDFVPGESIQATEHHIAILVTKLLLRLQGSNLCSINFHTTDDLMDFVAHNLNFFNSAFKIRSFCDFGATNTEIFTSPILGPFSQDQYQNHTIRLNSGYFAGGLSIYANEKYSAGKNLAEIYLDENGIISQKTKVSCWMQKSNGIYTKIKLKEQDTPINDGDSFIDPKIEKEAFVITPKAPKEEDGPKEKEAKLVAQLTGGGDEPPKEDEYLHPAAFGSCQARDYVAWQTSGEYRFKRYKEYKKDWKSWELPDEKELKAPKLENGAQYCEFGKVKQAVTEAEGKDAIKCSPVPYRDGDAFVGILPDGSIMLREPGGSSIELRSGRIIITCPKDLDIQTGNNTNIISARDIILKARKSIDLNTTDKHIRVKSGGDVMIDSVKGSIQITALDSSKKVRVTTQNDNGEPEPQATPCTLSPEGCEKYSAPGIIIKTDSTLLNCAGSIHEIASSVYAVMSERDTQNCGEGPPSGPFILMRSSAALHWSNKGEIFHQSQRQAAEGEDAPIQLSARERTVVVSDGSVQGGQFAVFEKTIYAKEYLFCEKSLVAVEECFINGEYYHDTKNPYVLGPYKRPEGPIKIPKTEPARYAAFGAIAGFANPGLLAAVRMPWKEKIYGAIGFRYRPDSAYGVSDKHVWFESFWQRQYKDELKEWYDKNDKKQNMDACAGGGRVYPGVDVLGEEKKQYFTYKEKNVNEDGTPKLPEDQKKEGGEFKKKKYSEQLFPELPKDKK